MKIALIGATGFVGTALLGDQLLMSGAAPAKISVSDLAVAVIDELEKPRHIRKRFTAAY